eukprot:CAMPEP_0177611716 /NCGR_PEP_ID=MMETSP0419_2-20121207/20697_1 /TAXON_ID=582737 /ORGANISM="Tetraselmis sp., Strain GSL018" /LENGTH=140 /DNA_ID=CAMNT_0019107579 /DNA_START=49 /DNA_END=471 /DNA_ORIENTATION=+
MTNVLALERAFVTLSLVINCCVLAAVCYGLFLRNRRMAVVYGEETPARGILLAVYLAILLVSLLLIPLVHVSKTMAEGIWMAVGLFLVQIVYKIIAWFSMSGGIPPNMKHNPVAVSNLVIAAVHLVSVAIVGAGWTHPAT